MKIPNSKFQKPNFDIGHLTFDISHSRGLGFTMIELLIVMSIIGILAAISIFGLSGARESARDGRRKADLEAIRSTVEIYKADCNVYPGTLPAAGSSLTATCTGASNTYIEEVPGDPLGGNYSYSSTGTTYVLCSTLEDPPSPSNDTSGCGSCAAGSCAYKVTNP